MVKLSEILEEITERSEHFLSVPSLIRKINEVQGVIFRNYVKETVSSAINLLTDLSIYPLPSPMGSITNVLVNGQQYDYVALNEDNNGPFYYILDGTIGLSPVPTMDITQGIMIFHKKAPHVLTVNSLEQTPDLDSNFHMLLVYGVLSEIDSKRSAEYKSKYDDLLVEFAKANEPPMYRQIQPLYTM